jgi:hypothetical protein
MSEDLMTALGGLRFSVAVAMPLLTLGALPKGSCGLARRVGRGSGCPIRVSTPRTPTRVAYRVRTPRILVGR